MMDSSSQAKIWNDLLKSAGQLWCQSLAAKLVKPTITGLVFNGMPSRQIKLVCHGDFYTYESQVSMVAQAAYFEQVTRANSIEST